MLQSNNQYLSQINFAAFYSFNRNRGLLKSQQIPQENFEIDPRITEDLNNQLQSELNFVHKKMSFKLEKSKLRLKKLMDHFVDPITCLPFCVHKIL